MAIPELVDILLDATPVAASKKSTRTKQVKNVEEELEDELEQELLDEEDEEERMRELVEDSKRMQDLREIMSPSEEYVPTSAIKSNLKNTKRYYYCSCNDKK